MAQLRVYLKIEDLKRQFAAYMATPVRARGYVPVEGMHSLIVEIAPALAIHRVIDLALTNGPVPPVMKAEAGSVTDHTIWPVSWAGFLVSITRWKPMCPSSSNATFTS